MTDPTTTTRTSDGHPPGPGKRVLVLGLGNDVLSDDGVGLLAVRQAKELLSSDARITVLETCEMGLCLLDHIAGFSDLLLVDAVQTLQAPPGHVHEIDSAQLKRRAGGSPHFLGVGETLSLGTTLGLPMPRRVSILAVEVADPFTMGTALTPALQAALPRIVDRVVQAALALAGTAQD